MIRSYVALGDSLSKGVSDWGRGDPTIGFAPVLAALLRRSSPKLEFINLGVGGARAADVLGGQLPRVAALAPELVTLAVGANDVPNTPVEQFGRSYDALLRGLRDKIPGTIVVTTIPHFGHLLPPQYAGYRALLDERIRTFNRIIIEAAETTGALLVDLQDRAEVQDPQNVSADGIHPNARGYRIMARAFVEALNRARFDLPLPPID